MPQEAPPAGVKRARGILANVALLLASTTVGLILVEAGIRAMDGVPLTSFPNFVARALSLLQETADDANRYDALLGWHLRENQKFPGRGPGGNDLTIGELGVRMNSGEIRPVPRKAILAIGDSFTAGAEVGDHETWPAQLERLGSQPVVNGGVGGYGVDQMVLRAERLAAELQPHTILVVILSQDILRNVYDVFGGGPKPYFTAEGGKLVHHNNPVPRITARPKDVGALQSTLGYSYLIHRILTSSQRSADWWIDNNRRNRRVLPNEAAVGSSCLLMERLARLGGPQGPRIVVGFIYGGGEVAHGEVPWFVPPVADCARKAGLEVLDFWPRFKSLPAAGLKRLYVMRGANVYGHFSAAGNRYVADALCSTYLGCAKARH
jgi:hypothetical protein